MDWQQTISLLFVFITAVLFVRGAVKKKIRTTTSACGSCPNCSAGPMDARK